MRENRKHLRQPVILKVDYRDVDKFFTNFAENLSEGGMFIATSRLLKPGTTLLIEFLLPETSLKIKTRAEVVWIRTNSESPAKRRGMGIKFQDLRPQDKAKINKIVKRLKRGLI